MYEYLIFSFQKFSCWTQHISCVTEKSILSLNWSLQVSTSQLCILKIIYIDFCIYSLYWIYWSTSESFVMSQILVMDLPLKIRFSVSAEKVHTQWWMWKQLYRVRLCTVKLKYLTVGARRKTRFLTEGRLHRKKTTTEFSLCFILIVTGGTCSVPNSENAAPNSSDWSVLGWQQCR